MPLNGSSGAAADVRGANDGFWWTRLWTRHKIRGAKYGGNIDQNATPNSTTDSNATTNSTTNSTAATMGSVCRRGVTRINGHVADMDAVRRLSTNIRHMRLQSEQVNFTDPCWDDILGGVHLFPLGPNIIKNYAERMAIDQHIVEAISVNSGKNRAIKIIRDNRRLANLESRCIRKLTMANNSPYRTYETKWYAQSNTYSLLIDPPTFSLAYLFGYCRKFRLHLNLENIILKIWIDVFGNVKRLRDHGFAVTAIHPGDIHFFEHSNTFCLVNYANVVDFQVPRYDRIHEPHANDPQAIDTLYLKRFLLATLEYSDVGKIQQKIIQDQLAQVCGMHDFERYVVTIYKRLFVDKIEFNKIQSIHDIFI